MNAISVPEQEISVRDGRNLRRKPWGHQRDAIDFLRRMFTPPVAPGHKQYPAWKQWNRFTAGAPEGGAAYLAMGMGTGKSLVGVSMCSNLKIDTALIVAPKSVVDVWPQQFALHGARKDLAILALGDDRTIKRKTEDADLQYHVAAAKKDRFVLVVNYEMIFREPFAGWVLGRTWGLIILDEIHRIKQPGGKQSMFLARLRDRSIYRLGLSGTPLPHSPLDIYAQYRFLRPDIFGTSNVMFKLQYAVTGGYQGRQVVGYRNTEDFEKETGKIMFRVGKEVLDLPEEMHLRKECHLSPGAASVYQALEDEFVAQVKDGTVTVDNALVKLVRLQQLTSGFIKTDAGVEIVVDTVNAKRDLLAEHFEDIAPDEPIVVFCRFRRDLELVHEVAKEMGRESLELSGERKELARWQAGEANVLAAQIQSGSVGVDLTRARYSIYFSLTFNLGEYEQSLCRVHRPGQTRTTFHIHLLAAGTIDTRMMRALEKRQDLVNTILDEIKKEQRA